MVIIYRTNINNRNQFQVVTLLLSKLFQDLRVNIDLEDSEKVLRLEGKEIISDMVITSLERIGVECQVMTW